MADYTLCDGYSPPRLKKNPKPGEVQRPWRAWGADVDTNRIRIKSWGLNPAAACSRALNSPEMLPEFWLRSASLLRARAMHEIHSGGLEAALITLDEYDALNAAHVTGNQLVTVKAGSDILRAIALYQLKKTDAAQGLLAAVAAQRPYSSSYQEIADRVELTFIKDRADIVKVMHERVKFQPQYLRLLVIAAIEDGRFEDAVSYVRQLSYDMPRGQRSWTNAVDEDRPYDLITIRAIDNAMHAYALFALGRMEESATVLKSARDDVAVAMTPPPPPAKGEKQPKKVQRDYDRRVKAGTDATELLDSWSSAMALRRRASSLTLDSLVKDPDWPKGDAVSAWADLVRQLKPKDLSESRDVDGVLEEVLRLATLQLRKMVGLNYGELSKLLPYREIDGVLPPYRDEGPGIWGHSLQGYKIRKSDDPNLVTVRMASTKELPALTEENALLVAAEHVQSLGKDGFVIENARRVQRQIFYSSYYSTATQGTPSGFEVQLLIRPITLSDPSVEHLKWRAFSAEEIRSALTEKFPRAVTK